MLLRPTLERFKRNESNAVSFLANRLTPYPSYNVGPNQCYRVQAFFCYMDFFCIVFLCNKILSDIFRLWGEELYVLLYCTVHASAGRIMDDFCTF